MIDTKSCQVCRYYPFDGSLSLAHVLVTGHHRGCSELKGKLSIGDLIDGLVSLVDETDQKLSKAVGMLRPILASQLVPLGKGFCFLKLSHERSDYYVDMGEAIAALMKDRGIV